MTSSAPWAAIPQATGVLEAAEDAVEEVEEKLPKEIEEKIPGHRHSSHHRHHGSHENSSSDTSSSLKKVASAQSVAHVTKLARQITQHSVHTVNGHDYPNPFLDTPDPALDPRSGQFKPEAWIRTLIGIVSRDPDRYPQRTAGVAYRRLNVHGFGRPTDYQKTFGNYPLELMSIFNAITGRGKRKIQILRDFEGLVRSGEMLVVLGRPGAGCSTLLKTIAGETSGFYIDEHSEINYQGIPKEIMHKDFRGECIYQAEVDVHFPQLTVGQTLEFAALARTPRNRIPGVTREQYARHMTEVTMAVFGLTHTFNTKVGNDFIRGVSGGERKRVSIAEAALGGSPLQCWDNSTRGLDSATALEFVRTLRLSTSLAGSTAAVAIYQASQNIYDVFDKVVVLYEGRQIYFGRTGDARAFFTDMGFICAERATTGDFLTSLTNPAERVVRTGFEGKVPQTPDEFADRWRQSDERARLLTEIDSFNQEFPVGGPDLDRFRHSRQASQMKIQRPKSPYTISIPMQAKLCVKRGFQRLRGDASISITSVFGNSMMALVIGSVFYNLPDNTGSFYSRGALLFFAILLNAFSSVLEILTLYAQRPIVEKQTKYAFYHPLSEAIASMICDLPNKILTSIFFNLVLYFMTNLRRTPSAFFTFYLFSFVCTLAMSMFFRLIGSMSRTLAQAMAPSAVLILALVIYTGFVVPIRDMHPWFRWINYIDPVAYAFESLMINEFHNRRFPCSSVVPSGPGYENASPDQKICSPVGSRLGQSYVEGDDYINLSFSYYRSHLWRNLGILFALMIGLCAAYLLATEFISAQRSKGEVLLFRRGMVPKVSDRDDEEAKADDRPTPDTVLAEKTLSGGDIPPSIQKQTAVFHWEAVNYDIKIKGEGRRILNDVDGWVKPGTLTALMGATGAGKTSLLDTLASRVTMGVVSGQMLVNGRQRDSGFQRKTGYVQQQDLHLATSTVREALNFSAVLRQPTTTPIKERLAYVDEVIKVLEMETYADAVVGVPGEGLNVEQRKRLTIAVELAAKPALLLFLDEPTSGLDSQTAWSIVQLLRKLANNGQAILCTIHQPSAILFQEFDRLLFLAYGGRTVYFGDIGRNSKTLTDFFERNGSRRCGAEENPAEWMLDVIGAAPGSQNTIDWPQVWRESPEKAQIRVTLADMKQELQERPVDDDPTSLREFAVGFNLQLQTVSRRIFEQYWRTPSYLYSKVLLCTASSLFIGFSFWDSANSLQGLQNQLFSLFMLMTIFSNLVQQMMPHFVTQRALYESRERPSKTYSWKVFVLSNILVELPWQTLMSVIIFFCYYYPVGMYHNAVAAGQTHERGALMWLFSLQFMLFTSTFSDMVVAGIPDAETAGNIANLLFSLALVFCGVLVGPKALPGFWIFMYRVSPFTYLVDGYLSTGIANNRVQCSDIEYIHFNPPSGSTCGQYMASYIRSTGGYLTDDSATENCSFCTSSTTNAYLAALSSEYSTRWRNFGILWAFIVFNAFAALFFYWWARVPKKQKVQDEPIPIEKLEKTKSSRSGPGGSLKRIKSGYSLTKATSAGGSRSLRSKRSAYSIRNTAAAAAGGVGGAGLVMVGDEEVPPLPSPSHWQEKQMEVEQLNRKMSTGFSNTSTTATTAGAGGAHSVSGNGEKEILVDEVPPLPSPTRIEELEREKAELREKGAGRDGVGVAAATATTAAVATHAQSGDEVKNDRGFNSREAKTAAPGSDGAENVNQGFHNSRSKNADGVIEAATGPHNSQRGNAADGIEGATGSFNSQTVNADEGIEGGTGLHNSQTGNAAEGIERATGLYNGQTRTTQILDEDQNDAGFYNNQARTATRIAAIATADDANDDADIDDDADDDADVHTLSERNMDQLSRQQQELQLRQEIYQGTTFSSLTTNEQQRQTVIFSSSSNNAAYNNDIETISSVTQESSISEYKSAEE